jgi:hypothetical protein
LDGGQPEPIRDAAHGASDGAGETEDKATLQQMITAIIGTLKF